MTDLKSLSRTELIKFITDAGLPVFRARQIMHWIYGKYACSLAEITELSMELRERLAEKAFIGNLTLSDRMISHDGTEKYLFGLKDGETIESVLIPDDDRLTLCISSQVGCAMGCRFCLTGSLGLKRNLGAGEIVDQVISVSRAILPRRITNIVFMGMGEPLANLDNVSEALWRMTELLEVSPRRITLSTSGLAPMIAELSLRAPQVHLAVSLNATTDAVRDYVMPVNKAYPIKALLHACRRYPLPERRKITFEYVLLRGVNDSLEDAGRVVSLLQGIPAKVNLIPFNPYEGSEFRRPEDKRILAFQSLLASAHMPVFIRKSKGSDILAACGQLKAKYALQR